VVARRKARQRAGDGDVATGHSLRERQLTVHLQREEAQTLMEWNEFCVFVIVLIVCVCVCVCACV
jgi:hypothetical protein